jgi:3-dehydroquinate synthase
VVIVTELKVKVPGQKAAGYAVRIGSGLLKTLWSEIERDFPGRRKFVVADENLAAAGHLDTLLSGRDVPSFVIDPPGEASKNIKTVEAILEAMERRALGRDSLVVALGGGTVGDIAAFAAAVFKRGVPVVHVPTTTVSQADSSIGGKTGVDSSVSKNAFGAFHHPAAVYMDVETLKTLDEAHYRAGLAESVKHALIKDAEYFAFLENNAAAILARDPPALERVAIANTRIKASFVEIDPYERNERRILNYGHTVGHAVEAAGGYELLHGRAVSIGMTAAGLIEVELGIGAAERLERTRRLMEKFALPVTLPGDIDEERIMELARFDKKAAAGRPRFVLLEDVGRPYCPGGRYAVEVEPQIVGKALRRMMG